MLKIATIGVAGERGVRYAAVVNDLHRAAGRSGVGTVMGAKNLKAIAVRGTGGVRVKDPQRFMQVTDEMKNLLAKETGGLTKYGTNAMMDTMQEFGGLPTNNFQEVQFDGYDKIDAKAMLKTDDTGHTNLDQQSLFWLHHRLRQDRPHPEGSLYDSESERVLARFGWP